jgi:hypothetical protein
MEIRLADVALFLLGITTLVLVWITYDRWR